MHAHGRDAPYLLRILSDGTVAGEVAHAGRAIDGELKAVLGDAINALPGNHRAAFLLHDVEGLSNPAAAETLHLKLATVKSRVHRARLFLRKRLGAYMQARFEGGHS